jgi:hypothetical protein
MTDAAAGAGASPAPPQKLDELMLAMDVVDTLRHQQTVVDRALAEGERDDTLRERLRQIYRSQGIEVPNATIDEGIRALKESRFVYTPPVPGLSLTLAKMWVRRGTYGRGLLIGAIIAGLGWGGYVFGIQRPAEQAAIASRVELSQTLPRLLTAAHQAAVAEARVEPARLRAGTLLAGGQAAITRGDAATARETVAEIDRLTATLRQEYTLRIASLPNEQTGFFRESDRGGPGRRYFLVVNALDRSDRPVQVPVRNEETNSTETVSRFAVGVPLDVWDAVRRDKQANGVLQGNRLGEKRRGELETTWLMRVAGGTLTRWQ